MVISAMMVTIGVLMRVGIYSHRYFLFYLLSAYFVSIISVFGDVNGLHQSTCIFQLFFAVQAVEAHGSDVGFCQRTAFLDEAAQYICARRSVQLDVRVQVFLFALFVGRLGGSYLSNSIAIAYVSCVIFLQG